MMTSMKTEDVIRQTAEKRRQKLEELRKDPFVGFSSLDEAIAETRFTSQPEVLARLIKRENLFISGLAGSGKTTIINTFISLLDAEYDGVFNVAVTASTGIAASLIAGQTIHSWAGLGISTEPFDPANIEKLMWSKVKNLKTADVLVIDEISMLPAHLFIKLDKALKHFRRSKEPFGGVQLVLIGDFLQLPPVAGKDSGNVDNRFAIQTEEWREAEINHCFLDKSYRATDKRLRRLLLEIAAGKISDHTREIIEDRQSATKNSSTTYTTLFTTNRNVEAYNDQELRKNPNPPHEFVVQTRLGNKKDVDATIKKYNIPETLILKTGATVILTKNIGSGESGDLLANGSLGVIEGFLNDRTPIVRFNNGSTCIIAPAIYQITERTEVIFKDKKFVTEEVVAAVEQLPLKLGYAITVHKSQGQTFDGVELDLSKCFQDGLGYVALSRVRSVDDLVITGFNPKAYRVSELSRRITRYVKKNALALREEFLSDKESYETLLTSELSRSIYWNVDEAASVINSNSRLY